MKLGRPRWRLEPYPISKPFETYLRWLLKRDPEIADFNPLAVWALHYLVKLRTADLSTLYE
jgi:hypothetical protein